MKNEVETQVIRQSGMRTVYKNSKSELVLKERRNAGIREKIWHYFIALFSVGCGIAILIMFYGMIFIPDRPLTDVETGIWIITGIVSLLALFFIYTGIIGLLKEAPKQHVAETVITEKVKEIIYDSPDEFNDIIDAIQKFER